MDLLERDHCFDQLSALLRTAPEAIRQTARRNKLPIDRITEVRILDPYFYT